MALPREALEEGADEGEEGEEGDADGGAGESGLLAEVGDEALFDDDDLPEDLE